MTDREHRVLIYAPRGRDAEITERILREAGIPCSVCPDVKGFCDSIREGCGAAVSTAEALDPEAVETLASVFAKQPPWSEIPVLVFTPEAQDRKFAEGFGPGAHVTLLDRPVHIKTLLSMIRSALRTRRRQYEIRGLMERLEERIQERDRFLAILGHELRNPLGAILLASQLTEPNGYLAPEQAQTIERQTRHLTRLVNDLLDLSRIVSGKITLQREMLDLREVARQTLDTLRGPARVQNLTIHFEVPEEPLWIEADPVRAEQIIANLLSNAIKYTPENGTIRLVLRREGDEVAVQIEDDGVGIDPSRLGTVFELFAQAENAIGRSRGGMGIGLALVRNLVELHGGSVHASSDGEGKGSAFAVRFPAGRAPRASDVPAVRAHVNGSPQRIVVIEDNADVRELLRLKLTRLGHEVSCASDGPHGVSMILETKPSIALIDIGLPGMDGYEVARRVRADLGGEVALVAVTGFGRPEDKRRAFEAGFDEHVTKPAGVSDLESILARFAHRGRPAAS